jgi:hypothetical protein
MLLSKQLKKEKKLYSKNVINKKVKFGVFPFLLMITKLVGLKPFWVSFVLSFSPDLKSACKCAFFTPFLIFSKFFC